MGRLTFPQGSRVYVDTAPLIYTTERHVEYSPILEPFWEVAKSQHIKIVTSELTLLEALVLPIRQKDEELIETYDVIFTRSVINFYPISTIILREAARVRATQNLKTPDAIHAATAMLSDCEFLIANDPSFRRLNDINVIILSDLL